MTDRATSNDNRWPDVLESPMADAMRNLTYPASFMLEMTDLFDKMEREIRCHRGTFCTSPSMTHEEKPE